MSDIMARLSGLRPLSRQPPPPPSPPAEPCPWLWRCHHCRIIYGLATTRRCLECDHEFCLGEPNNTSTPFRKRKRGGPCKSEFDYAGWAARGAWRRTVLLNAEKPTKARRWRRNGQEEAEEDLEGGMLVSKRRWIAPKEMTTQWGDEHTARNKRKQGSQAAMEFDEKKDAMFLRKRHDCSVHCDFPSQCHHAMFAAQSQGRPVLSRATAVDDAYVVLTRAERARARGFRSSGGKSTMVEEEEDCEEESDSGDSIATVASLPPLLAVCGDGGDQSDRVQILTGEEGDEGHVGAVIDEPSAAEYLGDENGKTTELGGAGRGPL